MACTNLRGWPGYRRGRGPDWTTTGVIRPVTEIERSVVVTVDVDTRGGADQFLVDAAFPDQTARCAVGCGVAVVDLAGGKPAIRHGQHSAVAGGLVHQLRCDQTHAWHQRPTG